MNKTRIIFVILIVLAGAVDLFIAFQNPELEANPGLVLLRDWFGDIIPWVIIGFAKFCLIGLAVWLLLVNKYRSERQFFLILSLFTLLLLGQCYGIITGVRANMSVLEYEEKHGEITPTQKEAIAQDMEKISVTLWKPNILFMGIMPLLVANLSFFLYERIRKDITLHQKPKPRKA